MANVDYARIPEYFHRYVRQCEGLDLTAALAHRHEALLPLLRSLPEAQWNYAYAPGKWTIKELVQHITDTERIFSYRALCFARRDKTSLPSFDENGYAAHSGANERTPASILEELEAVLRSTDTFFANLPAEALERAGTASGNPMYVGGVGYILCGHILHHTGVLKERYLQPALA